MMRYSSVVHEMRDFDKTISGREEWPEGWGIPLGLWGTGDEPEKTHSLGGNVGCYAFFDVECLYVGSSQDLYSRVNQHLARAKHEPYEKRKCSSLYHSFYKALGSVTGVIFIFPAVEYKRLERWLILALLPRYNVQRGLPAEYSHELPIFLRSKSLIEMVATYDEQGRNPITALLSRVDDGCPVDDYHFGDGDWGASLSPWISYDYDPQIDRGHWISSTPSLDD